MIRTPLPFSTDGKCFAPFDPDLLRGIDLRHSGSGQWLWSTRFKCGDFIFIMALTPTIDDKMRAMWYQSKTNVNRIVEFDQGLHGRNPDWIEGPK